MTSASATARCLREMALHCTKGHSSLTELTLLIPWRRDTNPMAADFHTYSVCSAQLLPLLSFTNLQTVFLASPVGFDLDDSMVADMARAWPRVKLLYLFSSRSPRNAPLHVTLGGLLPLAQFCPQLSDLMISLDASVLPPKWQTRRKAAQRVSQSCFHDLSVKHSPVGEPLAVAAFLSSIFPALSGVRTDWDYEFRTEQELLAADPERAEELEPYKRWNAVSAALKALRMVRAEERYWTRRKERE
ncbi:hypothetical protein C8R47DRAFT_252878 [Mycena vitilis]|nr:hypothetical protein C8R47DRAFT_252878 [Mycena vitilis]